MIAFALVGLFVTATALALGVIGAAVSVALPRVRELKTALAECPEQREMRFTIREVAVAPAYAKVIALPLRFKSSASHPLRAAA
ncbi:MAG: hypothetical protein ACKOOL_09465 [Novosphingobium sp.]